MQLLAEAGAQDHYFFSGNGQTIRELILRQAVKSCLNYATDVVYLFNSQKLKDLTKAAEGEMRIYFRVYGVDWCGPVEDYNYVMLLEKSGDRYKLWGRTEV